MTTKTSRICGKCKRMKPLSEFYSNPTRSSNTQIYCKQCLNSYTTERFRRRKKQAVEYKGSRCVDCGGVFPYYVYDFHHLDPTQKEMQFNRLRRRSWETIKAELDKCVLLCANCHRIRHWEVFNI